MGVSISTAIPLLEVSMFWEGFWDALGLLLEDGPSLAAALDGAS